jgi:oxygen-independent coproporphyrinogen-3 oxidase
MEPRASIYLHIPFCEKKCLYCDFYSVENSSLVSRFLSALHTEIDLYVRYGRKARIETIYFGGGTPSLLHPDALGGILDHLHEIFSIASDCELTVEVNPGTVDAAKLRAYRSKGVNRLSIGVQSFQPDDLRFLSRIHTADDAVRCFHAAREAGFENLSVDLIFALPGQTRSSWEATLVQTMELRPDHLSAYGLIVEENTPLARMVAGGDVQPATLEQEAELLECTMAFMRDHGYEQYEVSNYAMPGFRSRHNFNYWSHVSYLGFGPSAHAFWRNGTESLGHRWWNVANLTGYIEKLSKGVAPVASEEMLDRRQLANERVFLGLRSDGIDIPLLEEEFQVGFAHRNREEIRSLLAEDLAVWRGNRLCLTSKGYLVCDEIARRLMAP